ncbi:PREDICTED: vacuolar protein sorting-associated protein 16 homolog [Nicrophorus vespilloides]|uniref:Vacuolar protein sorting-associated protein 16 homolog n=1 Tax=Nicrophorus vespilloides TaxID=110193 RepID=A0ABM1NGE1_NICVS|nr:PREDICTED: vacuolar protein sorting-associated protein 16 homolog [Nicrophorus vespilloides]
MSAAMLTADWFLLGRDLYFRKFEIYSLGWQRDVNVNNVIAVAAPYGGPIAVRRDNKKLVKVQGSGQLIISIYSGSARHIKSIKWEGKPVVKIGWSNDERLICVQENGKVTVQDVFGSFEHTFTISQKLNSKVVDAAIFTNPQNFTGIAVLTEANKIFYIENIYDPKEKQLSDLPRVGRQPTSWVVISQDRLTEVLIAKEKALFRLTRDEHHPSSMLVADVAHEYTSIIKMAVSINARHVAFFTDAGYLWMGSSDLRTKYCELDTEMITKPKQLVWCGTEAVVAFWEKDYTLMVMGRHGEKMTYSYEACVHLVPEIDGVRILSATQHELVQKVPDVVQKIFRINSTDPGSFLLEASKQFQRRSHRADEYISLVNKNLGRAVEQCIEAAGYEFDTEVQKMLIRAAQFGKCFVSSIDSDEYVEMCRLLRVLNAVRDPRIGIPMTKTEYDCLSRGKLLDRLVTRGQYFLAIQIAKYLKMPEKEGSNRILVHWAKYKVGKHQPVDDEMIAKEIGDKLGYTPGISYSEIAKTASDNGRTKLAIKLLDYEPRASEQVKLLVDLKEYKPALVKAIESGDTDLIYDVILKLRGHMTMGDFKLLLHEYSVAIALYIKYCKEHDPEALTEILIQEDDFDSQAQQHLIASLDEKKNWDREMNVSSALKAYKVKRNDLNASICEETVRLFKHQKTFEEKLKKQFVGKSAHDTCRELLLMEEFKLAEKFKGEYKIPDKR